MRGSISQWLWIWQGTHWADEHLRSLPEAGEDPIDRSTIVRQVLFLIDSGVRMH